MRLKERKDPDLAEFEKRKAELAREAELTKWERVLTDWTHRALQRGASRPSGSKREHATILRYEDSGEPPPYEPCAPHRDRSEADESPMADAAPAMALALVDGRAVLTVTARELGPVMIERLEVEWPGPRKRWRSPSCVTGADSCAPPR